MKKVLDLKELFDLAAKNAARMFLENDDHEVLPMWHAINGKGENMLIATPWSSDEEKDATTHALRALFRREHVKRFAFVVEAWVRQAINLEDAYDGRISQHEDRREVLMISAEDRDGSQLMGWYYILRPEHGPPKLSELHLPDMDMSEGRMTGLLT